MPREAGCLDPRSKRSREGLEPKAPLIAEARRAKGRRTRFECVLFPRRLHCPGKRVRDGPIQRFRGNGRGCFEVDLEEVKEQTVFAKTLPFRKLELGYELLVSLVVWHRASQG